MADRKVIEDRVNSLMQYMADKAAANKEAAERQKEWATAHKERVKAEMARIKADRKSGGGGSGGSASDTREMQLGADLDPKAMIKREGMKKGGKVKSASSRADGCACRGKTKGRMV